MIGKVTRGAEFTGLARYLTGRKDRVAFVELRNVASRDPHEAAKEMQITAELSTRCQKPVYHISLAFDTGDHPTEVQLRAASERVLKALELESHQVLVVAHRDKAHAHVHMMINRVHPDTGRAWSASHDYRRIERALRDLEKEWHMRQVPGRHARAPGLPPPRRRDNPFAQELRNRVGTELKATQNWEEYRACLQAHGLHLGRRGQGMVLSDGVRYAAAGRVSESRPALERRFGETLDENRARRLDSHMYHLRDRHESRRVVLHRVHVGHVAAMERFLERPEEEMMRQLARWTERQAMRTVLQALKRSSPHVQGVVREARQHEQVVRNTLARQAAFKDVHKATQAVRGLEARQQNAVRPFLQALKSMYTDPYVALERFRDAVVREGPEAAVARLHRKPSAYGNRLWRARLRPHSEAVHLGQAVAAAYHAVQECGPALQATLRSLKARLALRERLQPTRPIRDKADLGHALTQLEPNEQRLVQRVIGTRLTQVLHYALEHRRDRGLGL